MPEPTDTLSDPLADPVADTFLAETEAYIARWHGIAVPNETSRRLAADMAATIRGFEAQRGRLRFEDEPSSFEAALRDMREPT